MKKDKWLFAEVNEIALHKCACSNFSISLLLFCSCFLAGILLPNCSYLVLYSMIFWSHHVTLSFFFFGFLSSFQFYVCSILFSGFLFISVLYMQLLNWNRIFYSLLFPDFISDSFRSFSVLACNLIIVQSKGN